MQRDITVEKGKGNELWSKKDCAIDFDINKCVRTNNCESTKSPEFICKVVRVSNIKVIEEWE